MRHILWVLAAVLLLAGRAPAQEAASPAQEAASPAPEAASPAPEATSREAGPQALPFTFIPKAFQGKWVLTEYQFPPIGPSPPTDPDYFIGKIIEIGNTEVIFFGHACETTRVYLGYSKHNPRFTDFDKRWIPDGDIKVDYPYFMVLTVQCDAWRKPLPQGPEALFLYSQGRPRDQYFRLYDSSAGFITTNMTNGPRYILRPVK